MAETVGEVEVQVSATIDLHQLRLLGIVAEALSQHSFATYPSDTQAALAGFKEPDVDEKNIRYVLQRIAACAELVDRIRQGRT